MVVIDNLKQKRKPETTPKNKDTPSKPLGKKTSKPTPSLEPSTSIEPNTSPLEIRISQEKLEEPQGENNFWERIQLI